MEYLENQNDVPIWELVEYEGPQLRESETEAGSVAVQTLNTLARTQPNVVASVLADWIDSRPTLPR